MSKSEIAASRDRVPSVSVAARKSRKVLVAPTSNYGVVFTRDGGHKRVFMSFTSRVDLQLDRYRQQLLHAQELDAIRKENPDAKRVAVEPIVALIIAPSEAAAKRLLDVLDQFWRARGRGADQDEQGQLRLTVTDAIVSSDTCRRAFGFRTLAVERLAPRPQQVFGLAARHFVERRLVDNPVQAWAEFLYQTEQNPDDKTVGQVEVEVNLSTLLGGLALIPAAQRIEAHEMAAKHYRRIVERCQIGGARAVDPGAIKVGGSGSSMSSPFEAGEDARRTHKAIQKSLGLLAAAIVEQVLIYEQSISHIARKRYGKAGVQARQRVQDEFMAAMDLLAVHLGFMGRAPGSGEIHGWMTERPPLAVSA